MHRTSPIRIQQALRTCLKATLVHFSSLNLLKQKRRCTVFCAHNPWINNHNKGFHTNNCTSVLSSLFNYLWKKKVVYKRNGWVTQKSCLWLHATYTRGTCIYARSYAEMEWNRAKAKPVYFRRSFESVGVSLPCWTTSLLSPYSLWFPDSDPLWVSKKLCSMIMSLLCL